MARGPPKHVAVDHGGHHAAYVGRTRDGRQFFLTTPFVPGEREFIALYVFDTVGRLRSAAIDDLGPRETMDGGARQARRDALLASLGPVAYGRIRVAPFRVEMFGVEFGFIPRPPEEPGEGWSVVVMPGDVMCFGPPWSRGWYET
jgi:hypothetical protein